ncbi:hypothetical protein Tco_0789562, partial [Tanacetum coccineum]
TDVSFDPFPSTDEPEKRPLKEFIIKFSVLNGQKPLTLDFNTFCSSTGLDYNNSKYVNHPTPEAVKKELGNIAINPSYLDKTCPKKLVSCGLENSIHFCDSGEIIYSDLVTKLLNKSRLKYVSYPRFISCALQVLLGSEYTQDKKFGFLPPILSNSNFTKDPSKVTDIELIAHMIVVNNQRDSVSPPPLAAKPKKGKSQTVTSTLPKSQGPEASGALSKKSKRPKSKKPPTETKVTPPKPTEGSEQSHSVSSGTIPDPQDLERDIQLASTRLPSTLDEGTHKSKPLPEGSAKTTSRPEGLLRDKDSGGNIPPANMKPIHTPVDDPSGTGAKYQDELENESDEKEVLAAGDDMDEDIQADEEIRTPSPKQDEPEPSQVQEYASDSSSPDLKKNAEKQWEHHEEAADFYDDLKASIDQYYD